MQTVGVISVKGYVFHLDMFVHISYTVIILANEQVFSLARVM